MSSATIQIHACPYCGAFVEPMHSVTRCPRVKAVEFYENGIVKRVEFHA